MGRASNRKKAQRQAGPGSRKARQSFRPDAAAPYQPAAATPPSQLPDGLHELVQLARVRVEREAAALSAWHRGAEPVSAETPPWPENSLGDRLLRDTYLGEAQDAPCLLTAQIPDAAVIAANTGALEDRDERPGPRGGLRRLSLDHPAVSMLLGVLAPIAQAELAYGQATEATPYSIGTDWDDEGSHFPVLDAPVYLLGGRTLVDTVRAAVGGDPLGEVIEVLIPALDGAIPGLDGRVATDALFGALAADYRFEEPDDLAVLERIEYPGGNVLETLVTAGAVPSADVLPTGLAMLSALTRLCLNRFGFGSPAGNLTAPPYCVSGPRWPPPPWQGRHGGDDDADLAYCQRLQQHDAARACRTRRPRARDIGRAGPGRRRDAGRGPPLRPGPDHRPDADQGDSRGHLVGLAVLHRPPGPDG